MKLLTNLLYLLAFTLFFTTCKESNNSDIADLVLKNGNIYTVSENQERVEAIAIKEGKVLALGTSKEMEEYSDETTNIIDLNGQFTMPRKME